MDIHISVVERHSFEPRAGDSRMNDEGPEFNDLLSEILLEACLCIVRALGLSPS